MATIDFIFAIFSFRYRLIKLKGDRLRLSCQRDEKNHNQQFVSSLQYFLTAKPAELQIEDFDIHCSIREVIQEA